MRKTVLYREAEVREYWVVDTNKETATVYGVKRWDAPVHHSFLERIKVGIYEDLYIDFSMIKES